MVVVMMVMMVMRMMKADHCPVNRRPPSSVLLCGPITEMPPLFRHNTTSLEIRRTHLKGFPPETFTSLTHLSKLYITENHVLKTIGAYAFYNLSGLHQVSITKSKHLKSIHKDAFVGLGKLEILVISNTGLEIFPDFNSIHSAASGFVLDLEENSLDSVPTNAFRGLCTQTIAEIRLTRNGIREVASDAFNGTQMLRLFLTGNLKLANIDPNAFSGSGGLIELNIMLTAVSSLPESILGGLESLKANDNRELKKLPPPQLFTSLCKAELTYSWHCCAFNINRSRPRWHEQCSLPEAQDSFHHHFWMHCNSSNCSCTPMPDIFNPCEDIMTAPPLRVLIWFISVLALLGNSVVLLVLLGSRAKLTVPRFLMCHLAFADLCMGVYLVAIATMDILTRGQYYNFASDWQMGLGCSTAGFFTVFASELSMFTLTAITLERWHTITHALRLDRKLRLRHACVVMSVGWGFAFLSALLPTVGVSSYGKVSICLPMDVEKLKSQVYVVTLLLLNVLAFLTVCICYLSIYLTVRNPSSAPAHAADTDVAKRMAVLIFTDFLCMAPISFFAIPAALNRPLINVTQAKLLIIFYPINSCANPFLYAFFTRTFRQDFFLLTARFGLFKAQAQIYRTESSSCQQPAWTSPKSSHGTLYSLGKISH
ncbi:unnamed protein product [Merluccius merluccius]